MSKKKTVTPKAPTAKYKVGAKVYQIFQSGSREEILEAEVVAVRTFQIAVKELGRTHHIDTSFQYEVKTGRGSFETPEYALYPSFFEVAKEFAKAFLYLLK